MHRRFFPLLSVVMLAGCLSGPDYHEPKTVLPEEWPELRDALVSYETNSDRRAALRRLVASFAFAF